MAPYLQRVAYSKGLVTHQRCGSFIKQPVKIDSSNTRLNAKTACTRLTCNTCFCLLADTDLVFRDVLRAEKADSTFSATVNQLQIRVCCRVDNGFRHCGSFLI